MDKCLSYQFFLIHEASIHKNATKYSESDMAASSIFMSTRIGDS